ncbi:hypothetical protein CL652_01755 [bacterium]|nr:hypothetical protein [bacterium]
MKLTHFFLVGVFTAGIMTGAWLFALLSAVMALILRRNYLVLSTGVLLDLWFATVGDSFLYIGFYSAVFLATTVVAEAVRRRLF